VKFIITDIEVEQIRRFIDAVDGALRRPGGPTAADSYQIGWLRAGVGSMLCSVEQQTLKPVPGGAVADG
jgi:hypothetical protein